MALQKQIVSFPFSGLSQKESPMLLDPGELLTLENGFFQNPNEIRKRFGYQTLYTAVGTANSSVKAIAPVNSTTLVAVGDSYTTQIDSRFSTLAGPFPLFGAKRTIRHQLRAYPNANAASFAGSVTNGVDVAYANSQAYMTAGSSMSILDLVTGAKGNINSGALATTTTTPGKVVATASSVCTFGIIGGQLYVSATFTGFSGLRYGATALTANMDASGYYDVKASVTTTDRINIAYRRTGAAGVTIMQINANTGAVTLGPVLIAEDINNAMAWQEWDESDGNIYLMTASSNGVRHRQINATTLAVAAFTAIDAAATNVINVTGTRISTTNYVIYDHDDGTTNGRCVYQNGTLKIRDAALVSRSFTAANASGYSGTYAWVTNYGSSTQGCVALYELAAASPTALLTAIAMYASHSATASNCQISSVVSVGGNKYAMGFLQKVTNAGGTYSATYAPLLMTIDFAPSGIGTPETFAGSLFLPGTCGYVFDGEAKQYPHPTGLAPETPTNPAQAAGGSLTLLGTYSYVAVYSAVDKAGRIWRSAPSAPLSVTMTGSNQTATIRVRGPGVTAEQGYVRIELYRTQSSGTTLYKVAERVIAVGAPAASGVANYDFSDTVADTAIVANEQIYSTSEGALPNYPAKNWIALRQWRGRLWGISAEDPSRVYYTKAIEDGIGPAWVGDFTFTVPDDEGDFTAVAEMDDKLVLFKRAAIYVLTGNGPANDGSGLYENPERISTKAGTTKPECVVKTPVGLVYQSPKGIHLLTRGLETQYIGAPVEVIANSLTLTGAICLDDQNQVRFMSSNGTTLVYDWITNAWATFTNQVSYACCMWQNKATWLGATTGTIYQETVGAWLDPGSANITTRLVTGWITFAAMQTYKRVVGVRVFGFRQAQHTLTLSIAYDENDASLTAYPTAADVGAGNPYQLDFWLSRHKAGSVKITLQDGGHGGTGEGARWHGLAFTVAVKPGVARTTT